MLNFFTEGKGKVVNKTRIVFGRDRDGYLIKLFLWLGIIPELSSGVQLIGLIQFNTSINEKLVTSNKEQNQNETYSNVDSMLVNIDSGEILGVTPNCYRKYGLKSNLFNQKTLKRPNLSLISPELMKKTIQKNMRLSGVQAIINTSELPEKYFFLRHYAGSDEDY